MSDDGGGGVGGTGGAASAADTGSRVPHMVQKVEEGSAVFPHDAQVLAEETGADAGAAFAMGLPQAVQNFESSLT